MSQTSTSEQRITLRSVVIGALGCVVLTAVSLYTALKLGALPWPIVFAAILSLLFLRLCGSKDLHEANISHTMMTAGSMVAGGLAFTIPGIMILGAGEVNILQLLLVALSGTLLGLAATALFRRRFIEETPMEYPIGEAAAQTLVAGDKGGATAAQVFIPMGIAAVYGYLRDRLALLPQLFFTKVQIPGITFGVYNSPMLVAVGFLLGGIPMIVWIVGALFGDFFLIAGGSSFGWWDAATGSAIKSSLGMGIMIGGGVAVVVKTLLSSLKKSKQSDANKEVDSEQGKSSAGETPHAFANPKVKTLVVLGATALAFIMCLVLDLGVLPSIIVVSLVWVAAVMSIISVGHTGIDPMEVFGLLVMLAAAALSDIPQMSMFFIAAIVAVACGLVGDVMNDFHAGRTLGTAPRLQFISQAIGAIIGAVVAALTMHLLIQAYGPDAFGIGKTFISTQASTVALLVSGIPHVLSFIIGLLVGFGLFFVGIPSVLLGLGVYLPFYMSVTAFIGGAIRLVVDAINKRKSPEAQKEAVVSGTLISSGVLGGESIAGVIIAFMAIMGL